MGRLISTAMPAATSPASGSSSTSMVTPSISTVLPCPRSAAIRAALSTTTDRWSSSPSVNAWITAGTDPGVARSR